MNLPIGLFVALRYSLGHNRDRLSRFIALLSGMGLVLGVAMMITVLSVMNGFDRELRERILVVVPHIKLYTGGPIGNWQSVAANIGGHSDVLSVHPYTELEVLARYRGNVEPMLIYAVDPLVENQDSSFGELLGSKALQSIEGDQPGVLLGAGLAKRLGAEQGSDLTILLFGDGADALKAASYEVLSILHTGTEADQRLGVVSLQSLLAIPGQSSAPMGVRVQTTELFGSRSLAYQLLDLAGPEYRASTWAMTHGNLYEAIQMSRNLVSLIVLLILAIAAFNLIATLMIASADKQNELAVLKTMGASPATLARIFALQGLIVGLIGAGIGAVVGVILSTQISAFTRAIELFTGQPILQSDVYPLDYLPSDLSLIQVAAVVGVAIVMSVFAALYPAWKVSKVDPAQVLRYE